MRWLLSIAAAVAVVLIPTLTLLALSWLFFEGK